MTRGGRRSFRRQILSDPCPWPIPRVPIRILLSALTQRSREQSPMRNGILAYGFLRVVCPKRRQKIVVAYSCNCRGACPSCSARRRRDSAAHLADHILPDVQMPKLVPVAPPEARRVLALLPDELTAPGGLFAEEIARWQKHAASANAKGETVAVTFVPRYDSILHLRRRADAGSGASD